MARIQRQAVAAVFSLMIAVAGSAQAADAPAKAAIDPATSNDAKALYTQGTAEYALGHFEEALRDFERVYLLQQPVNLLYNIAQCHRQLKNFQEAAVTLRSFIRASPNTAQVQSARELLAEVEEALRAQQAAQTRPPLGLHDQPGIGPNPSAPPSSPPPTPAPPEKELQPSHPPVPPDAVVQTAGPRRRVYSWIVGGAGVAALAAGGLVGLASKSTANDLTSTPHQSADIMSMEDKFHTQVHTANALFAVGGALLIAGGVLYVLRY